MDTAIQLGFLVVTAIAGLVYRQIGKVVMARRPEGDGRDAGTAFGVWWYSIAVLQAGTVISILLQAVDMWKFSVFLAYLHFVVFLIMVMLAALVYYFVYLFTGKRSAWKPIAVGYTIYWIVLVYFITIQEPASLVNTNTGPQLIYANDMSDSLFAAVIGVTLLAPAILGAIGYFSLYFKVQDRSQKFRISIIAGSFIVWFSTSLIVGRTSYADSEIWQLVAPLVALLASGAVYVAFRPPAWLRERLDLRGYGESAT
jgi:hypothetical protein